MTQEQYYWYVLRPQMLRAYAAGCAANTPVPPPPPAPEYATISCYSDDGNCVCYMDGEQNAFKQVEKGTEVLLSASPAETYDFDKWSDDVTDQSRTIVVNADINLGMIVKPKPVMTVLQDEVEIVDLPEPTEYSDEF